MDALAKEDQRAAAELAECLRQHHSRLYAYLHSLVRDLNDADDLFQQTTLILWKKFPEYDRHRSFFAWACGIARLEVANFLRSRGRQRMYFSDELNLLLVDAHAAVGDQVMDDRREALAKCIDKLRQRDRDLLLECTDGAAAVHIAAARHGRSTQSIYNSLRRIRRALFECIARTLAQETQPELIP